MASREKLATGGMPGSTREADESYDESCHGSVTNAGARGVPSVSEGRASGASGALSGVSRVKAEETPGEGATGAAATDSTTGGEAAGAAATDSTTGGEAAGAAATDSTTGEAAGATATDSTTGEAAGAAATDSTSPDAGFSDVPDTPAPLGTTRGCDETGSGTALGSGKSVAVPSCTTPTVDSGARPARTRRN